MRAVFSMPESTRVRLSARHLKRRRTDMRASVPHFRVTASLAVCAVMMAGPEAFGQGQKKAHPGAPAAPAGPAQPAAPAQPPPRPTEPALEKPSHPYPFLEIE